MPVSANAVHVAVAVIRDAADRILVAKRPAHVHQGNLWEFPGGKLEAGETLQQALARELDEELGIKPTSFMPFLQVHHHYPDKEVWLDVWEVRSFSGVASGREGQQIQWLKAGDLTRYQFPQANDVIVAALQLPEYYVITPDPKEVQGSFIDGVKRAVQRHSCILQLRAKSLPVNEYVALAQDVLACCRQYHTPLLLNADPSLLERVDADGVHLPASRTSAYEKRPLTYEKMLACSCHDMDELALAQRIGANFAVLGPVQPTKSHPSVSAMGWDTFSQLVNAANLPVYALGGLQPNDLIKARNSGARGIAAIRGMWES